ncbi:MAG: hypothetical protein HFI69_02735 [Lachnospiraceae bacterium]|nr:hypothetical protein [Lachnospiraceae bacterium]
MDVAGEAQTLTFHGEAKLESAEGGMFQQNGKYYILNTGTGQYASADTLDGAWSVYPLQMLSDEGKDLGTDNETCNINPTSCILPVHTDNGVIYINISDANKWDSDNANQTRYVWLPVKFSGDGTIALRKLSHWKLDGLRPEEPDVPSFPGTNDSIDGLSGEILYDTEGERVYACGGEVHQVEENGQTKWYWFGVNDLEDDGQKKNPGKISLNAKKKTLKAGKKFQIRSKLPKGTTSYNIAYKSSRKSVVTVSKTGKVTARKKGNAVITVKTYNGKKAVLKIQVK